MTSAYTIITTSATNYSQYFYNTSSYTTTNSIWSSHTFTPLTTATPIFFPPNNITKMIWREVEIKNVCRKTSAYNCSLKDYKKLWFMNYVNQV